MSWLNNISLPIRGTFFVIVSLALMLSMNSAAAQNTPFPTSVNPELQAQLEQIIAKQSLEREVSTNRLSITLLDITDIELSLIHI